MWYLNSTKVLPESLPIITKGKLYLYNGVIWGHCLNWMIKLSIPRVKQGDVVCLMMRYNQIYTISVIWSNSNQSVKPESIQTSKPNFQFTGNTEKEENKQIQDMGTFYNKTGLNICRFMSYGGKCCPGLKEIQET